MKKIGVQTWAQCPSLCIKERQVARHKYEGNNNDAHKLLTTRV
jgi:hypothetical protein